MGFYDDYKLQASDYTDKYIASLPDVVSGQASTLKARFDALVKDVVAARFNQLLQALDSKQIDHEYLNDSISTSVSVAASTDVKVCSLSLTKGLYVLSARVNVTTSNTASRCVVGFDIGGSVAGRQSQYNPGGTSSARYFDVTMLYELTSAKTVKINVNTGSGTGTITAATLAATKLK